MAMAKTIGFGKLEREMLSNDRLPPDVRVAVVEFKNDLKAGRNVRTGGNLTPYDNRDGGLPTAAVGQAYDEHQVGQAHQGDPRPRGKRRLVALVDPGWNVLKIYFTDAHYTLGEWRQLQFP
jgi:guanyl-specific ribonuclease Sa